MQNNIIPIQNQIELGASLEKHLITCENELKDARLLEGLVDQHIIVFMTECVEFAKETLDKINNLALTSQDLALYVNKMYGYMDDGLSILDKEIKQQRAGDF